MTFLPIVDRELRVAAHLTATYRNRTLVAAAVTAAAVLMLIFGINASSSSRISAHMFHTLAFLTFLFCLVEGARKTADCLSKERREGTLGLLFLTDLKGYDIILGKLAATSLSSLYGLLAMLPILSLSLLLGGITSAEVWRTALALTNLLFFSLSVGMWVSSHSRVARRAFAATIFLVLVLVFGPSFFESPISPGCAFKCAGDVIYRSRATNYWESLLLAQLFSWLLLARAAFNIVRVQQRDLLPKMDSPRRWQPQFADSRQRAARRIKLLDVNPFLWLTCRDLGPRVFLWGLMSGIFSLTVILIVSLKIVPAAAGFLLPAFLYAALLTNFAVKIRLAYEACHCLAEARDNHALEMVLSTPLTIEEIMDGQFLALKRMFLGPVIFILLLELAGAGIATKISGRQDDPAGAAMLPFMGVMLPFMEFASACFALTAMDLLAVAWAGMWFGMSTRNENEAIFKTIFYVLLLPFVLVIVPYLGWLFVLLWPIFWIARARPKLLSRFRSLAQQRFISPERPSGWWPFAKREPAPESPPVTS